MKKLSVMISACMFSLVVMAQDNSAKTQKTDASYCVLLKDGQLMIISDGKQMNGDVALADGAKLKTDGTLVSKDGTETMLKNGECVNQDGTVVAPKNEIKK